ncbi:SMODS domain-containing nucleotidyltransferase [Methylococcus capsulatus]|uniref:SMODS domain-containing nucleotidyltransferase n=1 Tax=Methylococcus capsulatus TaxID=414 RepID=UPI001C52A37C|nr:nucleotidyltransferase domain-containing protein [Methylococcus capsulatus]QXP87469.1 nucleotidyltransferase domain-containing protein [Methylococcus capsulatus]QXP92793.1 nucleotidyltransferase domain-containing protein [Methylococcus capsulatus]UQN12477.1 nucleotidyltransferase domain-containing protein [Methylococcus capsulatus]
MTINSYLTNLANQAILRDDEKAGVQRSIAALQGRLVEHFGPQIGQHFVFGSYSRGTILPRSMDPQSDVDYMVIFSDSGLQPQSYLDRLRRFAELRYARSEVAQSHPTVALELNHIRFELVPALQNWWGGLQIPAKGSGYQSWQDTDPKGFNDKLTSTNQANGNLIKPLARLMKYWNAKAGYPFESYALEQQIASHGYSFFGLLASRQIGDYFFQIVDALDAGLFAPQWKRDAVARLKQLTTQARALERAGQVTQAETVIAKLVPPVGGLLGR